MLRVLADVAVCEVKIGDRLVVAQRLAQNFEEFLRLWIRGEVEARDDRAVVQLHAGYLDFFGLRRFINSLLLALAPKICCLLFL